MGIAVPGICGGYLAGQNLVGTWRTTWDAPKEYLNSRTFSITITEGPMISLSVNRPVLFLNARGFSKQNDTSKAFGRPVLVLNAKPFVIQPFLAVLLNTPRLYLRGRLYVLGLSASLTFGRPLLILRAGVLARAGRAGLIPTVPESRPLTPHACTPEELVATAVSSRTLVATATGSRTLAPTECVEELLVPTETEVR